MDAAQVYNAGAGQEIGVVDSGLASTKVALHAMDSKLVWLKVNGCFQIHVCYPAWVAMHHDSIHPEVAGVVSLRLARCAMYAYPGRHVYTNNGILKAVQTILLLLQNFSRINCLG